MTLSRFTEVFEYELFADSAAILKETVFLLPLKMLFVFDAANLTPYEEAINSFNEVNDLTFS